MPSIRHIAGLMIVVGCLSLPAGTPAKGAFEVIDFDALNNDIDFFFYPNLSWHWDSAWSLMKDSNFASPLGFGNSYGSPSGTNAAWNSISGLNSISVRRDAHFDFIGAAFTGLGFFNTATFATSRSVHVEGFDGATLVGSVTMALRTTGYDFLTANFLNVDRIRITNDGVSGHSWVMDDFTFQDAFVQSPPASPVPEPGARSILVGFALTVSAGILSRRRRTRICRSYRS